MRNEIQLSDEELEKAFEAMGASCNMDPEYGDIEMECTRDTIADFISAAADYREHGKIEKTDTTLKIRDVQVRKGDQRKILYVIDFGTVRGVVLN